MEKKDGAEYIISNFKEFNFWPFGDSNTFVQKFNGLLRINPHSDIDNKQIIEETFVGFYNNNARNTIIIIMIIWDMKEFCSLSKIDQIHNGGSMTML